MALKSLQVKVDLVVDEDFVNLQEIVDSLILECNKTQIITYDFWDIQEVDA